ncbi:Putative glycoside hydrolase superfamily [Septoria linicola]|uniref:Glycoside hydrolase superfamily n=1 Tax=Septoria linicola TaxID=215465 RepID=A0A9Q9AWN7_9PEZI|nr:putative glycoside hydrolase superfamily [Septoria linicola]USW56364.1 Putative glycoside hydrolase superfamily [Septoria linicola]
MKRSTAVLVAALQGALAQGVTTSAKRGLAQVETSEASDNHFWTSGDLTWYYNWKVTPDAGLESSSLQFMPMLWGPTNGNDQSFYTQVKSMIDGGRNVSHVLGFNEPDGCGSNIYGGSCLDAQTAATTWIREIEPLKDLGVKLGAPAVTSAPSGFNWLQNFFTACDGQCTPDFIPIHYYGDFQGLASHVGQVNATYENMTMWVTEWAYPDESLEDTQDFYNQSIAFFDRIDYITHYSYFGGFRSSVSNVGPNSAMLTQSGDLTDIGAWYLGKAATGNVPKGGAPRVAGFAGSGLLVLAALLWCLG